MQARRSATGSTWIASLARTFTSVPDSRDKDEQRSASSTRGGLQNA
jgi:hypothetical protein